MSTMRMAAVAASKFLPLAQLGARRMMQFAGEGNRGRRGYHPAGTLLAVGTLAAVSGMSLIVGSTAADAALYIDVNQSGTSVVATISGSLSLAGLVRQGNYAPSNVSTGIRGSNTYFAVSGALTGYSGFAGPENIGGAPGGVFSGTTTGLAFFINSKGFYDGQSSLPLIGIDSTYVSGAQYASSATFANQTLRGLNLTYGNYVYTSANDTITFRVADAAPVSASPAPEPASWAMMIGGFGMIGATMRRRKTAVATSVRFA